MSTQDCQFVVPVESTLKYITVQRSVKTSTCDFNVMNPDGIIICSITLNVGESKNEPSALNIKVVAGSVILCTI